MSEVPEYHMPEHVELHWVRVPPKVFFEPYSIRYLAELKDLSKIFIVSDRMIYKLGYVNRVMEVLKRRRNNVEIEIYIDVPVEPTFQAIKEALGIMKSFGPDNIVALGGGSVMSAAKIMWMLYEHPEITMEDAITTFSRLRENVFDSATTGKISRLICVPTTSGTGAEVSPYSVVVDDKTGKHHPLASFSFIPSVAIVDPEFTVSLPQKIVVENALDMLSKAIEAYTSVFSNDFANGLCLESLHLILKNFKAAFNGCFHAREKMHNASTIAGMAAANGYLGIVHALSYKIADVFHIHTGRLAGILLPRVIRYNAQAPKDAALSQLKVYDVEEKYKKICERTGIEVGNSAAEALAKVCEDLMKETDAITGISQCGVSKEDWENKIEEIATEAASAQNNEFNPKRATVEELKEILLKSFDPVA